MSQIYINIPSEDSAISLIKSYLDLNFEVVHAATNSRYADGNNIRLINLGAIASYSIYKLTSSSRKHLEDINHTNNVSSKYELITSLKDSDVLSIGIDRNPDRRQRELINNKKRKGKYHNRIMLKNIFGFAEHQEKATYGFGHKLTSTGNKENSVLNKDSANNSSKIEVITSEWYLPHYTPSVSQQAIICIQILSELSEKLQYVKRSVFVTEVKTQNLLTFELGTQGGINVPIWIIVCLQQKKRKDLQKLNSDTFYRPPVTSAECIFGKKTIF